MYTTKYYGTYLLACLLHTIITIRIVSNATLSRSVRSVHCRLLSFYFVSSFICLAGRHNSQLGKSRVNAKLKKYHLTFSGAGTAHNLYCHV